MRSRVPRVPRAISASVAHAFTRSWQINQTLTDVLAHNACAFTLASMPGYTDFTALYDAYRITHASVKFILDVNSSSMPPGNSAAFMPLIYIVKDYNDAATLASVNAYLEYQNCKVARLDQPVTVSLVPKMSVAAYGGGVFTSYSRPAVNPWVDMVSSGVEYYGLKWGVNGGLETGVGGNQMGHLSVIVKLSFECKETR